MNCRHSRVSQQAGISKLCVKVLEQQPFRINGFMYLHCQPPLILKRPNETSEMPTTWTRGRGRTSSNRLS
jgi:hypothetical protein